MAYWIIGGEWENSEWKNILPGKAMAWGPFPTYPDSLGKWREEMWKSNRLDDPNFRLFIRKMEAVDVVKFLKGTNKK